MSTQKEETFVCACCGYELPIEELSPIEEDEYEYCLECSLESPIANYEIDDRW